MILISLVILVINSFDFSQSFAKEETQITKLKENNYIVFIAMALTATGRYCIFIKVVAKSSTKPQRSEIIADIQWC